jgi:DCN1-like protein 1/2
MSSHVPTLRDAAVKDEALFKKVYLYTYSFARAPNQRSLPMETAIEYWKLLFQNRFQQNMDHWIEFLETEYKKSIAKDTWNCMYDFVQYADSDPELAGYDVDGA